MREAPPPAPRTPLDPALPADATLRYVLAAREPSRMRKDFETLAASIDDAQQFADLMKVQPDAHERALGFLLADVVLPEALREQKALERRARQKALLVDNMSEYYSRGNVGEGMYGRRSTRLRHSTFNEDAMFDSLGIK